MVVAALPVEAGNPAAASVTPRMKTVRTSRLSYPRAIRAFKGETGLQGATGPQGLQGSRVFKVHKVKTGKAIPQGLTGETGPQGPIGAGLNILGSFSTVNELPASGNVGDAYLILGDLYVWTGTLWDNVGNIQGPQGIQGIQGVQGIGPSTGIQGIAGGRGDGEAAQMVFPLIFMSSMQRRSRTAMMI